MLITAQVLRSNRTAKIVPRQQNWGNIYIFLFIIYVHLCIEHVPDTSALLYQFHSYYFKTNSSFQYEMSHLFYGRGPRLKPHFFFVLRSCHFLWPWPVIDLARFAGLLSQELSCQELLRSRSPLPCSHSDNELKCFATHFNKNTYTYTAGKQLVSWRRRLRRYAYAMWASGGIKWRSLLAAYIVGVSCGCVGVCLSA